MVQDSDNDPNSWCQALEILLFLKMRNDLMLADLCTFFVGERSLQTQSYLDPYKLSKSTTALAGKGKGRTHLAIGCCAIARAAIKTPITTRDK